MMGIGEEMMVFVIAVLSGGIVRLVYRCISCLRQVIRHSIIVIGVEDILFWGGTAVYLFVQIYHTSDGSIRRYFILGVVFGAVLMTFFLRWVEKVYKKIYTHKRKKLPKKY